MLCVTNSGLRGSGISGASLSAIPNRRSDRAEQHDAAIGGDASAIEGGGELSCARRLENGTARSYHQAWRVWLGAIRVDRIGFDTQSLSAINALRDTRQQIPGMR